MARLVGRALRLSGHCDHVEFSSRELVLSNLRARRPRVVDSVADHNLQFYNDYLFMFHVTGFDVCLMSIALIAILGYLVGAIPTRLSQVVDSAKGVLIYCAAEILLEEMPEFLIIPLFAMVLGCRFSVFAHFGGGPAIAPTAAFLMCFFGKMTVDGAFPAETYVMLLIVPAAFAVATRTWEVPVLISSSFIFIFALIELGSAWPAVAPVFGAVYLFGETISASRGLFILTGNAEIKLWRIVARPFALLFIAIDLLIDRKALLFVVGVLALIFIFTDFFRLATKVRLATIFKKKEINRFSSMTLFLVSVFLTFLLFPGVISYVSLICITIGDFFSKLIGIRFGKHKLYKDRTLEGTLGFFAGSLMFNTLGASLLAIPFLYVLIGSAIGSLVELFSDAIDDNFTVSIVCGGVLAAFRYFLPV